MTSSRIRSAGIFVVLFAALQVIPAAINGYPFVFFDTRGYYNAGEAAARIILPGTVASTQDAIVPPDGSDGGVTTPQTGHPALSTPNQETGALPNGGVGERAASQPREPLQGSEVSFSRSPYYGLLLFLLFTVHPFAVVVMQALAIAWVTWLALRVALPGLPNWGFLASGVVCCIATPLPYFVGYLMPDVFAGAVVLGIFVLAYGWRQLSSPERLLVWLVLAASLVFHTSHILLAFGLLALVALFGALRPIRPQRVGVLVAASALAAAVAGAILFLVVAKAVFSVAPANPPYLTARGLEDGPVAELVRSGCPGYDFAICTADVTENENSQVFLWDVQTGFYAGGSADLREQLSQEDFAVFWAAASRYPGMQLRASLRNVGRQFVMFGLHEFRAAPEVLIRSAPHFLPEDELSGFSQSMAARDIYPFDGLSVVVQVVVMGSVGTLIWLGITGKVPAPAAAFVLIVVAGLLLNAGLGGALSDPHHRYQARMIWLLPLIAAALTVFSFRRFPQKPSHADQGLSRRMMFGRVPPSSSGLSDAHDFGRGEGGDASS